MLCQQPLYTSHWWRVPVGPPQPVSMGLPAPEAEQPEGSSSCDDTVIRVSACCHFRVCSGRAETGDEAKQEYCRASRCQPPR